MNKFNLLKKQCYTIYFKNIKTLVEKKVTPDIKITQEHLSQKLNAF